ncbi:unnamed protein product [Allacma fusca]|uniref:Reverse transcriptase domain-containing protein n=1 Tax=Allacma fusca TaxID=39272 RepID=A0A8J2JZX7_9HEXA|nr:unnamed protein product [Allacma fusca]
MLFGADFQSKVKVQEEMAKVGKSLLQPKTPYSKTVRKSFPSKNKFVKNVRKESLNYESPLRWTEITDDPTVLQAIRGFKIPFHQNPIQVSIPRGKFFNKQETLQMNLAVDSLLSKGAITLCTHSPGEFISSVFLVPKSSGGYRFIINLSFLNRFITCDHFKMEDFRSARSLMTKGCFMGSLDLQDAYFLIPVHHDFRKILRSEWNAVLYEFTCLCFGLNIAPRIFTKIMRAAITVLRGYGYENSIDLDDSFIIGRCYHQCNENIVFTQNFFESLGLTINYSKSITTPTQSITYLGFLFDSLTISLSIPVKKQEKVTQIVLAVLRSDTITIRKLAMVIGTLVSCCPAVPYGMLYTKRLEYQKNVALSSSGDCFDALVTLSEEFRRDLHCFRHDATSEDARGGMNIEQIRLRAGWSASSSVFARFYNRPLSNSSEFAQTVFQV